MYVERVVLAPYFLFLKLLVGAITLISNFFQLLPFIQLSLYPTFIIRS